MEGREEGLRTHIVVDMIKETGWRGKWRRALCSTDCAPSDKGGSEVTRNEE